MIVLDTSVLIEALSGSPAWRERLRDAWAGGERIRIPTLVAYEWLRGPRTDDERAASLRLFPPEEWIPFGAEEAELAAELYRTVSNPRRREIELAIAACALTWDGALWTLTPKDFAGVPGLRLVE